MNRSFFILFFTIILISCSQNDNHGIKIEWINELDGDFSFTEKWDYPEYIFINEYGQLVCDGMCPSETDRMKDSQGRIMDDSLYIYYQYVDTTHLYHTIENESNSYEWAGTNHAIAFKDEADTIRCFTICNAATHSSLELKIIGNKCFSQIKLNSITNSGTEHFTNKGGYIKIDKPLFERGILKAEFSLDFIRPENTEILLWWKGKIYTKITEERN